ncbi:PAS domain-containing sensor histidine kinase [Temperatibacter marinus]|uniref:histidine kinase n=1 Tax=Temperatibacter marinus TaxID=1456591 RepID=A0AA52EGY2_9PROT|nr:PAS domain-containing sensor histidine kinase [Temperatibacter marinus]WND02322.1 PAS domain-containing sensor histidine kinase [Temperatibacter marinus]
MSDLSTDSKPTTLSSKANASLIEIDGGPKLPGRSRAKFLLWARRVNLSRKIEVFLAILAIVSAVATYIAMSRKDTPFDVTSGRTMQTLLFVNLVLIMAMSMSIVRWISKVWLARRNSAPGSRLHSRVIGVFSVIAIVPPIIMAVFSFLFLEFGVQTWFSEKVRSTVYNSLQISETYVVERRTEIQNNLISIAYEFNQLSPVDQGDSAVLRDKINSEFQRRSLSEIVAFSVVGTDAIPIAKAEQTLGLNVARFPPEFIRKAQRGEMVIETIVADRMVVGMIRLSSFITPTFIYISRDLDPRVLAYLEATRNAVADYESLEGERSDILLQFNLVFILVSLLILMSAIWVGLWFSSRLVTPLSNLLDASERVAQGDLQARVPSMATSDEVGTLSRAFNRMTDQLEHNQKALLKANDEMDMRRRFLEEVLSGVSTGVIGVHGDGTIFVPNKAACDLLGQTVEDLIGKSILDAIPEIKELLDQADSNRDKIAKGQINLEKHGETLTLLARIAIEREGSQNVGIVVTFDDLTEQLADQRTAAWADVARRIAHEIKNPLTPIQLSAERIKRKYAKTIEDPGVFVQCTDTIVRQVGDLRRMVDEFSSFARMPSPVIRETDLVDVIKQAVFLQDVGWQDIAISFQSKSPVQYIACDGRLLGQAITNLIKNAAESVSQRIDDDKRNGSDTFEPGKVDVFIEQDDNRTILTIEDNGMGLPQEQKDRLMEPYVTTRKSGTGLGLAIVRKIAEEHGARIRIMDRQNIGARAEFTLLHSALVKRAERQEQDIQPEQINKS